MHRPITTERLTLAGIPALRVSASGPADPAPTVLLFHGWSSSKESMVVAAQALACEGIQAFLPDLPNHGERAAFADYSSREANRRFAAIIPETIIEAGALLAAVRELPTTDPDRIGTAGSSMGGMIAAGVLARYPSVRAAVLLNGCPCLVWLDSYFRIAKGAPPASEEKLAAMRGYDPEHLVGQVAPRPLLMLHGAQDSIVPVDGVRRFQELARPLYAKHPERLVLAEIPRLDHYVTTAMLVDMRTWFTRHL